MKHIGTLSIVLILASISFLGFQSFDQGAAGKIKFDKLVHDFGVIEQGDTSYIAEFHYTNVGNDMMFISTIAKSCGCAEVTFSKEPIPPGGQGVIVITYQPIDLGSFDKAFTVRSSAENNKIVLKVKGEIVAKGTK